MLGLPATVGRFKKITIGRSEATQGSDYPPKGLGDMECL